MPDELTYKDLYGLAPGGEPASIGTLESINEILARVERMLNLGFQLAMQFDKIRNNPMLQKVIGDRMKKLGVEPGAGTTNQGGEKVLSEQGAADLQINEAIKLLEKCKLWLGDVSISTLIIKINENRDLLKAQILKKAGESAQPKG